MRLIDRIGMATLALSGRVRKSSTVGQFVRVVPGRAISVDAYTAEHLTGSAYKASSWVYAGIEKIARAAASVPWIEQTKAGGQWQREEGGELEQLIEYPNGRLSRQRLMHMQVQRLLIGGNALTQVLADARGGNRELWPMNPRSLRPIPDENEWLAGWENTSKVGPPRFAAEEVIHAQFPDPENVLWGMSPLVPLRLVVETDVEAVRWNRTQLDERIAPNVAILAPGLVTATAISETRDKIKEHYAGSRAARTPLVVGAGADVKDMGQTAVELDWIEGRKFALTEIAATLNLLPALFAPEAATYSNLKEARAAMWVDAIMPLLDLFADAMNTVLIPREQRRERYVRPDYSGVAALQKATSDRMNAYVQAVQNGITRAEAAQIAELNLERVPGDDKALVQAGLIPLIDAGIDLTGEEDGV